MADLQDALSNLKPEHLSVDHTGRVVINDPAVSAAIREAAALPDAGRAVAGNIICTGSAPANLKEVLSTLQEGLG